MIVYFLLLVALCIYKIKFIKTASLDSTEELNYDFLSVGRTNSIKGIFILIVFMSHFHDYVVFTNSIDIAYQSIFNLIGQRMVTLFMLYSGYGVMESIKKKNMTYVKKIPINRVLGVLFRFDIAILIFALVNIIMNKGTFTYSLKTFVLSLIGWESIGNSNWYIFAILVAYIATYFGFLIFKDKCNYKLSVVMTTLLILVYCALLRYAKIKDSTIWYDTILCYSLGMVISVYKERFTSVFNKTSLRVISIIVILFIQAMNYKFSNIFILREIALLTFALLVVLITMRFSIDNKYLRWCGEHLFGIYIMQRLPMMIYKEMGIGDLNIYLYFVLCLITTVFLAYIFEKYTDILWKKCMQKSLKIKTTS